MDRESSGWTQQPNETLPQRKIHVTGKPANTHTGRLRLCRNNSCPARPPVGLGRQNHASANPGPARAAPRRYARGVEMGWDENLRAERIRPCVRRQLPGACNVGSLERGSVAAWQRGSVAVSAIPLWSALSNTAPQGPTRARARCRSALIPLLTGTRHRRCAPSSIPTTIGSTTAPPTSARNPCSRAPHMRGRDRPA